MDVPADICIAGGGIAGLVLASRLAPSGRSIVVLEQGPRYGEAERASMLAASRAALDDFADYNDGLEPPAITPHATPGTNPAAGVYEWRHQRLFGLGGTGLHFEGVSPRPVEDDLQVRRRFGYGRDWPLAWAELEPWLLAAEREMGVSGAEDNPYASARSGPFPNPALPFSHFDSTIFAPALAKLGMTGHSCPRCVNSQPYQGRAACMACRICKFCPTGARYSADRVLLPVLDGYENVTIMPGVSLRRLETGEAVAGGRESIVAAHAVRLADREPFVVHASRFVLAMGGVETPRMLLLSGGSDGLGNAGGQLGRGFSDHLFPYATVDVGRPVGHRPGYETMISDHFRRPESRRELPSFNILASPAMDWFPVGNEATDWSTHGEVLDLDELRERLQRMAVISLQTELEGSGAIMLDDEEVDAFGDPVARVEMGLTDWDQRAEARFAGLVPELAGAMGADRVTGTSPPGGGLGYHPSGATAMGRSPDEGVCDTDLRVFGVDNLYLASSSVFPHMGAFNPTLTIVALTLRLAEHLGRST